MSSNSPDWCARSSLNRVLRSRALIGTFLAFDKYMNIVLSDTEEVRQLRKKKGKSEYSALSLPPGRGSHRVLCARLSRGGAAVEAQPWLGVAARRERDLDISRGASGSQGTRSFRSLHLELRG